MELNKYQTICVDPPWKQKGGRPLVGYKVENGKQVFVPTSNLSQDLPYPTMSVKKICAFPIDQWAAKDCHLYMWVTNKYLLQAGTVLDNWGFKYSTTLVWKKAPMGGGLGGTYRVTTEFLIFATKGKLKAKKAHIGTCFDVKREYDERGKPQHSRKPSFFMDLIEEISPGPYLEVFARRRKEGWDAYGNEIKNDTISSDT